MTNDIIWRCKPFAQLSVDELYDILQLRSTVFVVEQQCLFLDIDGIDKNSFHLFGYYHDQLAACCRLIDKNIVYEERASIGRVANADFVRGKGVGRVMMQNAIEACRALFGGIPLRIGAQFYLKEWYGSLGFVSCEDNYMEDGIEHIHMERVY